MYSYLIIYFIVDMKVSHNLDLKPPTGQTFQIHVLFQAIERLKQMANQGYRGTNIIANQDYRGTNIT